MLHGIKIWSSGLLVICCLSFTAGAQSLTMEDAISMARTQSVEALQAKSAFISEYWAYRSYKASRLPSLSIYGNLLSFDRSLRLLQNYENGEVNYTQNYNMQNSIGLKVSQNVTFTGGTVSLYSDLSRIDQFGFGSNTWYSQPVTFTYDQPLFAYNKFKWDKRIAPKEYERSKRLYLEAMEEVNIKAISAFFSLLKAKVAYDVSKENYENAKAMHKIALNRLMLGSVSRDECIQLELRMLNDSIVINENDVRLREAQMSLCSVLGVDDNVEFEPVGDSFTLPDISIAYEDMLCMARENSSFDIDNEISILNAESAVAKAKADRGISMQLHARFGLSNSNSQFRETYRNLVDQEVVGLTFSVPIFDWGLGKGRVKKAEAAADVVRAQVEQSENDFRRSLFSAVGQFNNQRGQCVVSKRASDLAAERNSLMMEKYAAGKASTLELNQAQEEADSSRQKYIEDVCNFWLYYYTLRKLALYDFIGNRDIDVSFDEMVE